MVNKLFIFAARTEHASGNMKESILATNNALNASKNIVKMFLAAETDKNALNASVIKMLNC